MRSGGAAKGMPPQFYGADLDFEYTRSVRGELLTESGTEAISFDEQPSTVGRSIFPAEREKLVSSSSIACGGSAFAL